MTDLETAEKDSLASEDSSADRLLLSYGNHGDKDKDVIPTVPPVIRLPCCPMPMKTIELKSMAPDKIELVTGVERCKQIVASLQREKVLAVAAEGINVGKEGPITLVQIATCAGFVYIFDVLENRDLVHKGRLRVLLENHEVTKVMHDCCKSSAALNYQFAVSLTNVFDTQLAHLTISEHKGRRLPSGLRLADLCVQYTDNMDDFYTYDWRTESKARWMAQIGNFWAIRPLTSDMLEYASGDVIVLIPGVYNHQMQYLEDNGLKGKFKHAMEEWLQLEIDDVIRERRGKRIACVVETVLRDIDRKYDHRATLFNILDQDEIHALAVVDYDDAAEISHKVLKLKVAQIIEDIKDIEVRLRMDAESWEYRSNILDYLRYYSHLPCDEVSENAREVLHNAIQLIREHIELKYDISTTPNMLSRIERDALLTIHYREFELNKYGPVITAIYWRCMHDDVHELINQFRLYPGSFSLTEEDYVRLEYFIKQQQHVPETVSGLASGLLHAVRSYNAENGGYVVGERRRCLKL